MSQSSRYEIVVRALNLAGRDIRLRSEAEAWLNDMLRDWALEAKYPSLRKTGSLTLLSGASSVDLPDDYGAGMDNLLMGDSRVPLYERSMDEFVQLRGFQSTTLKSGMPSYYCVDQNAGSILFDATADKNYGLIPIYYAVPATIEIGSAGDAETVWHPNDAVVVQGLIQVIYQYTGDQREFVQEQKVEKMKGKYRQGSVPMGGGSTRVTLARTRFK